MQPFKFLFLLSINEPTYLPTYLSIISIYLYAVDPRGNGIIIMIINDQKVLCSWSQDPDEGS